VELAARKTGNKEKKKRRDDLLVPPIVIVVVFFKKKAIHVRSRPSSTLELNQAHASIR